MREVTVPTGSRRRWKTLIFCVAPLAVLTAVFVFRIPVSQVLLWALILLCPLSHLLQGHGGHAHDQEPGGTVDPDRPAGPGAGRRNVP